MVIQEYSVCPVPLYKYGQLPVSQLSPFRGRCLLRSSRQWWWEQNPASWAEKMEAADRTCPSLKSRRFSASHISCWGGETELDTTWKPKAAMTHDKQKRKKMSCHISATILTQTFLHVCPKKQENTGKAKGDMSWYCRNVTFETLHCFFLFCTVSLQRSSKQ